MKVKVCGLTEKRNIHQLLQQRIDMMGLIFYEQSARMIHSNSELQNWIAGLPISKVGVFVNETTEVILQKVKDFQLDFAQLHGNESPEQIKELSSKIKIIKAFSVHDDFDFEQCLQYMHASLFLFDTKGKMAGGNGIKFNWEVLEKYKGKTPFLLSGGIHLSDVIEIKKLEHPMLYGVDLNSGFELRPGIKNGRIIQQFIQELKRKDYAY
ncbi:MAG: phosphoribosylanthranilate isomerase [Flavobacteriales bacterium]|jgi:phosphoribosylanthranilate isomerase|nr:phosphoribosylanthranilate isomerase [Flavobacteriales bacterium]